jgi:hypothetical protein
MTLSLAPKTWHKAPLGLPWWGMLQLAIRAQLGLLPSASSASLP